MRFYHDAATIQSDTSPKRDPSLRGHIEAIFDANLTIEDRYQALKDFVPKCYQNDLYRVVGKNIGVQAMTNWIGARR